MQESRQTVASNEVLPPHAPLHDYYGDDRDDRYRDRDDRDRPR